MEPVILYDNKLEDSTLTAANEATGFNVDYLKNSKTYAIFKPNTSGDCTINIDLGSEQFIGALGIANHNLGSVNASIKLLKSTDNIAWQTVIDSFNVLDDTAILKLISESSGQYIGLELGGLIELETGGNLKQEASTSFIAQYWRLEIATTGTPQLAVLYLGEYFKFEYPPEAPTIPKTESIIAISENSNGGHLLETDIRYYPSTATHIFRNIRRSWYKSDFEKFWNNHGKLLKAFFYAWDIENRPNDIFLVKLSNDSVKSEPLSILKYVNEINLNMEILA